MALRKFKLMFVVCLTFPLNSAELVSKAKGQGYSSALARAQHACKDTRCWKICSASQLGPVAPCTHVGCAEMLCLFELSEGRSCPFSFVKHACHPKAEEIVLTVQGRRVSFTLQGRLWKHELGMGQKK